MMYEKSIKTWFLECGSPPGGGTPVEVRHGERGGSKMQGGADTEKYVTCIAETGRPSHLG